MGSITYLSVNDVREKARRKYLFFLSQWLRGEDIFPLFLNACAIGPKVPYAQRLKNFKELAQKEKSDTSPGYELVYRERNTRREGVQTFLKTIGFFSLEDYLTFIGKSDEFSLFKKAVVSIRSELPELALWIMENPKKVLKHIEAWPKLCTVIRYFCDNDEIIHTMREIPLAIPTKFIEQNQPLLKELLDVALPKERIKRDESDLARRYGLKKEEDFRFRMILPADADELQPFRDLLVYPSDLARWHPKAEKVIVIENKYSFLRFPDLHGWLKIWGSGNSVALLEPCQWFGEKELYYWGDLDPQGFAILHLFRTLFPRTKSLFMNLETYNRFIEFAFSAAFFYRRDDLLLTDEESECYRHLIENESLSRIEQERLSPDWIEGQIRALP